MPQLARLRRRALAAASLTLILSGCARTMVSAGTDVDVACRVFAPIRYSMTDSAESQKQAREHNAAWLAICAK